MGGHRKEVNCTGCRGHGKVQESRDGTVVWVDCILCNGTGKAPA
jgi:DnaJ-class molecular chaperone